MIPENFKESSDPIADFTSSLIEISKECIPQTSTNPTKSNPWYNDDCKEAIKQRKQALSKFKRSPNTIYLSKYLKNVFLKLRQIQLKVFHGTMTTVKKQLNNANKLYLNSKDLLIPTIAMTSKYLELKPVEQLNFRSVGQGDLMFRKSIIKHLLKRFGI